MNSIPVIFAIDNNVVMQCGVTITSLLMNAKADTFYDIYILCDEVCLDVEERKKLKDAFEESTQCKIDFVDVGKTFKEIEKVIQGHVTTATYYRLLIPVLFSQFERVIYADIDIVFQQDLSELYQNPLPNGEWITAARDLAIDDKFYLKSSLPAQVGKSEEDYFNAFFLVDEPKVYAWGECGGGIQSACHFSDKKKEYLFGIDVMRVREYYAKLVDKINVAQPIFSKNSHYYLEQCYKNKWFDFPMDTLWHFVTEYGHPSGYDKLKYWGMKSQFGYRISNEVLSMLNKK